MTIKPNTPLEYITSALALIGWVSLINIGQIIFDRILPPNDSEWRTILGIIIELFLIALPVIIYLIWNNIISDKKYNNLGPRIKLLNGSIEITQYRYPIVFNWAKSDPDTLEHHLEHLKDKFGKVYGIEEAIKSLELYLEGYLDDD